MSESLRLMPGIADAIRRHGVETYPNECCGALIGADGVVQNVAPLPNTTEEGARRLGRVLLGFYHSHPDHPARPSQYDLDHAFPFFWYVIVSVQQAQSEKMTVWRLADDRSQFREASLHE
jgi:proteasome lid subunit RPN8/RPN11